MLYEIKKQQEMDTKEKALVVLNYLALHDLVPIAYCNNGNEFDNNAEISKICTALGIIDHSLYLISALYLMTHGTGKFGEHQVLPCERHHRQYFKQQPRCLIFESFPVEIPKMRRLSFSIDVTTPKPLPIARVAVT